VEWERDGVREREREGGSVKRGEEEWERGRRGGGEREGL